MRDLLLFGVVFSLLPFIFKRPAVGVWAYMWISLMNPHRLTYGAAYDFPFAAIVAGTTVISLLVTKVPKRLPLTPVTCTLFSFIAWTTLTSFFAVYPSEAWPEWFQVIKTMLMAFVVVLALNSKQDLHAFAWVLGLSLGFYGLKGGLFTLMSGGSSNVFGPQGTNIADNNDLALALVTTLPILWYLHTHSTQKWRRLGLKILVFFTLIAAVGTYSRGALLAGAGMLFFLWLKSEQKFRNGLMLALLPVVIYSVMPEKWFDRMESISEYKEDASAMGRINAWHFAYNVATERFFGGGFKNFTPEMFRLYAPNPQDFHAPHSIYFQVLGNHGFFGLVLFLILMAFTWHTGSRVIRISRTDKDSEWAAEFAVALQVSIVGFAVGGAFLSLAYFELYYGIIALMISLEKWVVLSSRTGKDVHAGTERSQSATRANTTSSQLNL